jgi:colanic acid/amylovoran biosynthesis glycosyltransferase
MSKLRGLTFLNFMPMAWFLKHNRFDWRRLADNRVIPRLRTLACNTRAFMKWRVFAPISVTLYRAVVKRLSEWSIDWMEDNPPPSQGGPGRIVYYLWSFPTLSETFIQRELAALINAGLPVEVIAHEVEDRELLGLNARALMERTRYLNDADWRKAARYAWALFQRHPLTFIKVFFYIAGCKYDGRKCPALDLDVFARAVYLASVLRAKGADHVHAPWASIDAFVALAAARLLKITYTVQARAYDIHRHTSAVGLGVKLTKATFVVTNSKYNESALRSRMPPGSEKKIHIMYDGIDLTPFQPHDDAQRNGTHVKILSVADLVAPKGLEYLIQACKILKDRGYALSCELIGGRVAMETNYYISLQKLRKRLSLEKEVAFLGKRPFDDVLKKYGEVDIFVLPAVVARHGGRDITPNAIIEAMAMKLPVVSTTSGAIAEVIEDGVSGILVPPRDVEALAEAIIRLTNDPTLRTWLGDNARKRVEERFDITKNVSQLAALFRESRETRSGSFLVRHSESEGSVL